MEARPAHRDAARPAPAHMATATRCRGPWCAASRPDAGRPVAGTRLCLGCRTRLAETLRRLPELYRECGERHFRTPAPAWAERPTPRRHTASTLHATAADVRHRLLGVLASWAGMAVESTGARPPRRAVGDLCAFLHGQLGFLVRHPAAGEFATEVAEAHAGVLRVARPESAVARTVLGRCAAAGCGGRLTARPARDRDDPARVECETDPAHSWSVWEWLARTQPTDAVPDAALPDAALPDRGPRPAPAAVPRWLSQADVTALWGVSRGSVYRMASEQRWERRRLGGRTYYAADDVRRALTDSGR
ncbi:helix-turn-helix domain-containing protein [Streptomyces sp. BRB081]|uniref:helix-turn-helix domain-containing protein n=1 Tax=Streptomyces sp. BRB081 TaxID=2769544 RepID=UPI0018ACA06B|nr:helix-turn-helix domain-containing protein [Streptomyces sp. BRB081]MBL3808341.1 helix-turn-helix domain-containing protein [Streptomyces sp. BRB081]